MAESMRDGAAAIPPGKLRYEILGPLRVHGPGRSDLVSAHKMAAVLALLLLRADQIVPVEQLVAEIWGERAPRRAVASLQVYVSHLRKLLAVPERPENPIVTRSPGYSLILGDDGLDLHEFQELLETGRSEAGALRHEHAVVAFGAALSLCRGPALHGLEHIPAARAFTTWYEESRLECTELLVESELALGRHRDLVGDLYTLISEHPLREVFHRQLMLAPYRSGRHADAPAVYRSLRQRLDRDPSLESGRALRDLHQAILVADGGLEYREAG